MTVLRAVEQDHDATVITGAEATENLVACLERDLARVPVTDSAYRHLRDLHDLLAVSHHRRRSPVKR